MVSKVQFFLHIHKFHNHGIWVIYWWQHRSSGICPDTVDPFWEDAELCWEAWSMSFSEANHLQHIYPFVLSSSELKTNCSCCRTLWLCWPMRSQKNPQCFISLAQNIGSELQTVWTEHFLVCFTGPFLLCMLYLLVGCCTSVLCMFNSFSDPIIFLKML